MSDILIPRLDTAAAGGAFARIQAAVRDGMDIAPLVSLSDPLARCADTGGRAADEATLGRWRSGVIEGLREIPSGGSQADAQFSAHVGRLIDSVIDPIPADAGHDGVWSFLTLDVFPDVVIRRWGPDSSGELSRSRWIGAQMGRDRNFFKTSWWRWRIFGEALLEGPQILGEDELVQLTERSALARNPRVLRHAASVVIAYEGSGSRMEFTRELVKRLTWRTGARLLDVLSDGDLRGIVEEVAESVPDRPMTRRELRAHGEL